MQELELNIYYVVEIMCSVFRRHGENMYVGCRWSHKAKGNNRSHEKEMTEDGIKTGDFEPHNLPVSRKNKKKNK